MPDRRTRIVAGILFALGVLVLGTAGTLEVVAEPAGRPTAEPVPVGPPQRGVLHCAVTAGEEEAARLVATPAGERPTEVTVLRYDGDGPPARDDPVALAPDEAHVVDLEGAAAQQPAGVLWEGGPAVASWVVQGGDAAGAPCEAAALPTWHVTGFDTTAQNDATLHVFNPFAIDAVVRVTFGTPTGRVALVLTDNVLVPARSTVRLDLNEYEPEQPELAATVQVLTGRVVAQGEQSFEPTEHQPGPSGRTLLPGAGAPATEWAFGAASVSDGDASWLVVYNPSERDAAVEIQVSDPLPGGEVQDREYTVPAGATSRIDLADASEADAFAVVVTSVNRVPVVATRLTHAKRDDGEDVAASVGAEPATDWAVAGGRTADRRASLSLANPGGEPVTARVDAGAGTPGEWAAIDLAPNARVEVPLGDAGDHPALPLRVHADGAVVADLRVLTAGDDVGLWTATLVPATAWEGPGSRPAVRRDPTLSTTPVIPAVEDDPEPVGEG